MGTAKLLLSQLRRSRSLFTSRQSRLSTTTTGLISSPYLRHSPSPPAVYSATPFCLHLSRSFSAHSDDDSVSRGPSFAEEPSTGSVVDSGDVSIGFSEISDGLINASIEESIFPVRAVVSFLDSCHDFTGLPWWVVIASSTVAIRMALLPIVILQLKKLKQISEFLPKLPPAFPPPLSGRSYVDQFSLFRKKRKELGCPSYLWVVACFSIQVPCFLLWMTSIRRMSLTHHPGFDSGGALWFQNLTELPHGLLGPILPFLIGGLHYINIQLAFEASSIRKIDQFGPLAKYYKLFLDLMSPFLFFVGFSIPQGSLIYWVTNSSLNGVQHLFLKHPAVREKMGLPSRSTIKNASSSELLNNDALNGAASSQAIDTADTTSSESSLKGPKITVQNLSPRELLALSVQLLSKGQPERSIPLLKLALNKDPEYVRAMIVMGQTLLQQSLVAEATEYLEHATSKLLAADSAEIEDIDLLIVASQWAGIAYIRQGKSVEGIVHLERVGNMVEPEDPKAKAHYFDGLVVLASALFNNGRKEEAAKYLRLAAAYDPAVNELLEQCENDDDNPDDNPATDDFSSRQGGSR